MSVYSDENDIRSDELLVKAVQNGKKEVFNILVSRYHRRLLGLAYKIIEDTNIAEDIVQEAFLRAFEHIKECRNPESFKTWLFTIARNYTMSWLEKSKSRNVQMTDFNIESLNHATEDIHEERLIQLTGAFKNLPEEMKLVLIYKYWKGMTCQEIAKILSMPIGTVMSYLSRSYKIIKEKIYASEKSNNI